MVNAKITADSEDTAISPVSKGIVGQNIKIALVDDSNLIRETLHNYLAPQPDFQIVGSFDNAQTALKQIKTLSPDIVLMDIEMPGMDGISATRAIAEQFSQIKVIILSSHDEQLYLEEVLSAGAKGYLVKTTPVEELAHSIRFVQKGYLQFSPELLSKLESVAAIAPLIQSSTPSSSEIILSRPSQIQPDWSSQTKELIDALPQVWTRGLLYFLAIFTAIALPWAMFSQVDETGKAIGRLEPSGKTFILDAPVAGTVANINVQTGDVVEAGQSLLELESNLASSELQQLQAKLAGQQNQRNQLELLKKQLLLAVNTQSQETQSQKLEKQAQVAQAQQQLQFSQTSYNSQRSGKLAQINQAKQNFVYTQTAVNSTQKVLTKAQTEIERYRQAVEQGVISEVQLVEQENLIAEKQQAFDKAQSEFQQAKLRLGEQQNSYAQVIRQAESAIAKAQLQLQQQKKGDRTLTYTGKLAVLKSREQLKNTESEIATLATEIAQSQSEIALAQYKLKQTVLKAPVKGTVFDLPIQKPGDVLQPGDKVAEIAPEDSPLVVIAQMATAESGSLAKGMPVKLKFDAYPFQDYGIVTGKLTGISPTSKQGKVAIYNLEIKLERDCLPTANKCIALRPGDTATAEVIVRQRRIIDFILDPFKKLQQGGLDL
ncbi:MAG: response regulator [Pleurocapsa sp. SU_5_0]|nr:response regulator [Pleurocapsa sp. SU_5_0]NJR47029.1 response regulator [Hyellaceae cyanobacterium CSU_1_1]